MAQCGREGFVHRVGHRAGHDHRVQVRDRQDTIARLEYATTSAMKVSENSTAFGR